jgi:hypothetical protein
MSSVVQSFTFQGGNLISAIGKCQIVGLVNNVSDKMFFTFFQEVVFLNH